MASVASTSISSGSSSGGYVGVPCSTLLIANQTLSAASWQAVPGSALSARKHLKITNEGPGPIRLHTSNAAPSGDGVYLPAWAFVAYDLTDATTVYGRAVTGSSTVSIEELA